MDTPHWFSLDKYKPSKDPADWATSIFQRLIVKDRVLNIESDLEQSELFVKFLFKEPYPVEKLLPSVASTRTAREMNVEEFRDIDRLFAIDQQFQTLMEEIESIEDKLGQDDFDRETLEQKLATPLSDFSIKGVMHLSVNITHDDQSIEESVMDAVRKQRRKRDQILTLGSESISFADRHLNEKKFETTLPKRPISEQDFDIWHSYRILPFYDLQTWSMFAGKTFTYKDAARMLFPDGDGDEEKIRKTTKKHLESVISWNTFERLCSLSDST